VAGGDEAWREDRRDGPQHRLRADLSRRGRREARLGKSGDWSVAAYARAYPARPAVW
jgi:hypothetical protein